MDLVDHHPVEDVVDHHLIWEHLVANHKVNVVDHHKVLKDSL